jgi:hypothetical protein
MPLSEPGFEKLLIRLPGRPQLAVELVENRSRLHLGTNKSITIP